MDDVLVILNVELLWLELHSATRRLFLLVHFFNEHLLSNVIYILVQRANYWQFVSSVVEVV